MKLKIGVNCGHTVSGQPGCGAVGYIDESVEVRNVGNILMGLLKDNGHTVVNCTNDYASSTSENLQKIVSMANAQALDLFVSIHFNAGGGRGTEVYTYGAAQHTEAVNVCNKIASLGFNNRGVKDGSNLYVVKHTSAKAILIEVCFVDTDDATKYKQLGAQTIAMAIFEGIIGVRPTQAPQGTNAGTITDTKQVKSIEQRVAELEGKMSNVEAAIDGTFVANYDDENVPKWFREGVKWAISNGIIEGTGEGYNLSMTKMWFLTILYRFYKLLKK